MAERPDLMPNPEVLPDAAASRLLARASELDVGRDGVQTVSDLRAAATAAGISGRAFDAAVAELHGVAHVRTSDASKRRWPRAWIGAAAAATLVAAGVFAVVRPWGSPSVPSVEAAEASAPVVEAPEANAPVEAAVASAPVHHVILSTANDMPSVAMAVDLSGELWAALTVESMRGGQRVGDVHLTRAGGTATTPATLKVSGKAGAVTFRVPKEGHELELMMVGTWQRVRGHTIRVVRDRAGGPLRAEVIRPVP